jgi:hypothetical protein
MKVGFVSQIENETEGITFYKVSDIQRELQVVLNISKETILKEMAAKIE